MTKRIIAIMLVFLFVLPLLNFYVVEATVTYDINDDYTNQPKDKLLTTMGWASQVQPAGSGSFSAKVIDIGDGKKTAEMKMTKTAAVSTVSTSYFDRAITGYTGYTGKYTVQIRMKFTDSSPKQLAIFGMKSTSYMPSLQFSTGAFGSGTGIFDVLNANSKLNFTYTMDTATTPDFDIGWHTFWFEVDAGNTTTNNCKLIMDNAGNTYDFKSPNVNLDDLKFFRVMQNLPANIANSTVYFDYLKLYKGAADGVPAVPKLSISSISANVVAGETSQLSAIYQGGGQTIVWSSDNLSVATVSQSGLVTAVTSGIANISATAGGETVVCKVKVTPIFGTSYMLSTSHTNNNPQIPNSLWNYQYSDIGTQIYTDYGYYDGANWWSDSTKAFAKGLISPATPQVHSGSTADAVYTFTAPYSGVLRINSGTVTGIVATGGHDGGQIQILKNTTQINPATGWIDVPAGTSITYPNTDVQVIKGDKIHFRANKKTIFASENISWNPSVQYLAIALPQKYMSINKTQSASLTPLVASAYSLGAIQWSSNNENTATVVNGNITAVNSGIARVRAQVVDGYYDYCDVAVPYTFVTNSTVNTFNPTYKGKVKISQTSLTGSGTLSITHNGTLIFSGNTLSAPINVDVARGDSIVFSANGANWSTDVTYLETTAFVNGMDFDSNVSFAFDGIATEGGVQNDDTLQLALAKGQVTITNNSLQSGIATSIADAPSFNNVGNSIIVPKAGDVESIADIKFSASYTGSRAIKDIALVFNGMTDTSLGADFDILYSKTTSPTVFTQFYTKTISNVPSMEWTRIGLTEIDGQINNVDTVRVVVRPSNTNSTYLCEIDINDVTDGADIISARQYINTRIVLPSIFGNGMVLQRGKKVPVWGFGGVDGETITVTIAGQTKTTTVINGKWSLELDEIINTSKLTLGITSAGGQSIIFNDVVMGEVWLCAGQSNMQMTVSYIGGQEAADLISSSTNDNIRLFSQLPTGSSTPQRDVTGGAWNTASPTSVPNFSAIGYTFARNLQAQLNVPVGVVYCAVGGTAGEAWVDLQTLQSNPAYSNYVASYNNADKTSPYYHRRTTGPYNSMLYPLLPYAIGGIIWYQGESNVSDPVTYKKLLTTIIERRRIEFKDPNLPFLMVQLAPYNQAGFEAIREVQLETWKSTPNTALVVTTDVGEANDIHPHNKKPVGDRLALAANAIVYGNSAEYSGPQFKTITIIGDKAVLTFNHTTGGLKTSDGGALRGFEISSDGTTFVAATAVITGANIEVTAPSVPNPVAVKYGYKSVPDVNLVNGVNLLASPFIATLPKITIGDIKFFDSNNNLIVAPTGQQLQNGLKARLNISNTGTSEISASALIAHYENNQIENVFVKNVAFKTAWEDVVQGDILGSSGVILGFVFENMENIKPITKTVVKTIN